MDGLFVDGARLGPQAATARHDLTATPSPNDSDMSFSEGDDSGVLSPPFYPNRDTAYSPFDSDLDDDFGSLDAVGQLNIQHALQLDL
jgi:hypothetical protein